MEQPPKPVEQTPSPNAPDAQKLLESANNASQQVAVLHAAFIAACTYVMVIAFGRTDLDLLIGKGIRLPIVDTEVPIVGFFAAAPWILVIAHFNLLLYLQLLARKLHDFDQADQQGKLRSQLRIFPITWYLAGRTEQYTRTLLSLMASITIILLPLLALFILQLQFLAYQSEAITWGQRIAIWVDLGQLIVFWPLIIQSGGVWITLSTGTLWHRLIRGVLGFVLVRCHWVDHYVAHHDNLSDFYTKPNQSYWDNRCPSYRGVSLVRHSRNNI
ncbi:hypothetical protein [Chlorobaculum sp. 24CR]|uniref:hypothetical protein n=1 Tax=Chlorobaculum sp. 24CR TaxID=2508878 RepID=UPI001FD6BA05|nr:hypothetical protein [Chlorobaculum sp. 24CR]